MKTRIFANWKTTAIGGIVLVGGLIALFIGKVSGSEFIGIASFSATYLVAKDTLLEGLTGGVFKTKPGEEGKV